MIGDLTMIDDIEKVDIRNEESCPWFNDGCCDLFYSDKDECWYRKCMDTPNCYYRKTQADFIQLRNKLHLDFTMFLNELFDIASVNAIDTCWTILHLCDNCDEKDECETQSPLRKLDLIRQMINEYKSNNEFEKLGENK